MNKTERVDMQKVSKLLGDVAGKIEAFGFQKLCNASAQEVQSAESKRLAAKAAELDEEHELKRSELLVKAIDALANFMIAYDNLQAHDGAEDDIDKLVDELLKL